MRIRKTPTTSANLAQPSIDLVSPHRFRDQKNGRKSFHNGHLRTPPLVSAHRLRNTAELRGALPLLAVAA
jgi:hypothetical protein